MYRPGEYQYSHRNLGCASRYLLPIVSVPIRKLPRDSVVMDLGCGNGSFLAQFLDCGFELHGVDNSQSGVAVAQAQYGDIDFAIGDIASDLSAHPLAGKCDLVLSTEVVEHVFFPRAFAQNCYGFLKPGGKLVISTPYHGYLKNLMLAGSGKLDAHFTALWDYGHIKFWSRRTLSALLEESGFRIEGFQGAGRLPGLWKSMVLVATKPGVSTARAPAVKS